MRLRAMTESELRNMNHNDIVEYMQSALYRATEGVTPSEIIRMKEKIILAAMILKEKFPELRKRQMESLTYFLESKSQRLKGT